MFATPPLHARFGKIIHDIVHIILCPLVVEDAQYEHRNSAVTERQISNLTDLRIRDLLTDEEFNAKRQPLELELGGAEQNRDKAAKSEFTFEPIRILQNLCDRAIVWYQQADEQTKQP